MESTMAQSWPAWKGDQPLKGEKEETTTAGDQARAAPHEEKEDVAPGDATDRQNNAGPMQRTDGSFDYEHGDHDGYDGSEFFDMEAH